VLQAAASAPKALAGGVFPVAVPLDATEDAWGNLEVGADQPGYAFTGREWDPETGLYYYRARYYDPKAGRFLSEDPIGLDGGVNFYSYVRNQPTNLIDPFGLQDKSPGGYYRSLGLSEEEIAIQIALDEADSAIESADDEMVMAVTLGAGAIQTLGRRAAAESAKCALMRGGLQLSKEATRRMAERGITRRMIEVALKHGTRYYDPKNKTINFIVHEGMASGKDLLVGQNPITGVITTVFRGTNLATSRMIPLP
jgi:RHS repeat-associated protein